MFNEVFSKGFAAGSALREFFSIQPGMVIAHRVPGRRRYVCEAIKGHADVCTELIKMLQSYQGITSAEASDLTGSVTVCYTCKEKEIDQLFDALSHLIAGRHAIHEKSVIPSAVLSLGDNLNNGARLAKAQAAHFLNREEPLFFSRLVGIALLAAGLYRIVGRGDRPAGPQLFWWGLGLLLRQSHQHPKELIAGAAQAMHSSAAHKEP